MARDRPGARDGARKAKRAMERPGRAFEFKVVSAAEPEFEGSSGFWAADSRVELGRESGEVRVRRSHQRNAKTPPVSNKAPAPKNNGGCFDGDCDVARASNVIAAMNVANTRPKSRGRDVGF